MANELLGDANIASHYQLWFFVYNSGNPIALSAMKLRDPLSAAVKDSILRARIRRCSKWW